MSDKLLIVTKVKKTIDYVEKIVINFPNTEIILKNKLVSNLYDLLELVYKANIHKDIFYMKEIIVNIRMTEYYIKIGFDKKIISFKKYENIGSHLLEINKMVNSWIKYETSK